MAAFGCGTDGEYTRRPQSSLKCAAVNTAKTASPHLLTLRRLFCVLERSPLHQRVSAQAVQQHDRLK